MKEKVKKGGCRKEEGRRETLLKIKISLIKFFRETVCNEDNEEKIYRSEESKTAYKGRKEDFGGNKLPFYCKITLCIPD